MTYSLLAQDPETGAVGVGVQSHFFGVGRLVGWLEPGLGGVATQAFVDVSYGPRGLDLLRTGASARAALEALVSTDELAAYRQVAVVDSNGQVASFTGDRCVPSAGSRQGEHAVAQGNMLTSDTVYESMIDAFDASTAPFPERILAALRAAEDAGGDARGSQSAMLRVVSGQRSSTPWAETLMDVRVDDHLDPIGELTRLVSLHRAFDAIGDVLFAPRIMMGAYENVTGAELDSALAALEQARSALGANQEAAFWTGVLLARAGRIPEARSVLAEVFDLAPQLRSYLDSIAQVGFVDVAPLELPDLT